MSIGSIVSLITAGVVLLINVYLLVIETVLKEAIKRAGIKH